MKNFEGFIFDIDSTLINSNKLIFDSFRYISNKYLNQNLSDQEIVSHFGPTEDELIVKLFGKHHQEAKNDYYQFYSENHDNKANIYPLIKETIDYIKSESIPLSIFTGKGRQSSEITLEKIGLLNYFDLIVTGDDIEGNKPSREGVDIFIEKFNLNRENVLMIGDAPSDIYAARNASIKGASALWDSFKKEEMLAIGNDFEFHTVKELHDFVLTTREKPKSKTTPLFTK